MRDAFTEQAFSFGCGDESVTGILHPAAGRSKHGLLIVVGGPQYRVGSHRQFLLLARAMAQQGIPVMRFDYRGMGDSSGHLQSFEDIGHDIRAAVDVFQKKLPEVKKVIIWGLCDAASAAAMFAHQDSRIDGLILLNPWVRTEATQAKTYLKHYYVSRILSTDFWRKAMRGKLNPIRSIGSFLAMVGATWKKPESRHNNDAEIAGTLPERMCAGLQRFKGTVLFILSGQDLTADEFRDVAKSSPAWQSVLNSKMVTVKELPEANHTFSSRQWRKQVETWSLNWIQQADQGGVNA